MSPPIKKRLRNRKAKPGELIAFWGKMPNDAPDICYSWGEGVSKSDGHLLHDFLACKHSDPFTDPQFSKMLPSLLEEFQSRGYDIRTIRFSISKLDESDK
jgi:hypothetical protein